ncbi:sensor histidine kinase [Acidovorax sp.]|uniref:sensor histidine kinase n=1 Tax=Acidovorax sp. TaxID=1872122 RepID=UPI00391FA78D
MDGERAPKTPPSLRRRLMLWLAVPFVLFLALDAYTSYRATLRTSQIAFDRLLVTSAHALADLIRLERGELQITLPHAALEIYDSGSSGDSGTRSRMVYRVSYLDGRYLAGDEALAPYRGRPEIHPLYGAMIDLYDTWQSAEAMRVAALMQPVEPFEGMRLLVVQVGEPSAYRDRLAREILQQTLLRQGALLATLLALVWLMATWAQQPLRAFARRLERRPADDLAPLQDPVALRELQPVVVAFNGLLARLHNAREQQRRFVADASHQLRTPLSVLQLQADAGLSGDIPHQEALASIAATSRRATRLAEQLLSLARAQQTESLAAVQNDAFDLGELVSEIAIDLSPLIARKQLDFQLDARPFVMESQRWMVREILANLLRNAIEFTPGQGQLGVRIEKAMEQGGVRLIVWDTGPGMSPGMQAMAFTPFAREPSARPNSGAGLGLAICADLARTIGAELRLDNRVEGDRVLGLDVEFAWRPVVPGH